MWEESVVLEHFSDDQADYFYLVPELRKLRLLLPQCLTFTQFLQTWRTNRTVSNRPPDSPREGWMSTTISLIVSTGVVHCRAGTRITMVSCACACMQENCHISLGFT